jgi:CheY-like chemotaxis protein
MIADDDSTDQLLVKQAIEELKIGCQFETVMDGLALLAWLEKRVQERQRLPDLILLDINMPKMNGKETLRRIRANKTFVHIPVIMFSTSDYAPDVTECYALGANGYLVKPHGFESLKTLLGTVLHCWFQVMALPTKM